VILIAAIIAIVFVVKAKKTSKNAIQLQAYNNDGTDEVQQKVDDTWSYFHTAPGQEPAK